MSERYISKVARWKPGHPCTGTPQAGGVNAPVLPGPPGRADPESCVPVAVATCQGRSLPNFHWLPSRTMRTVVVWVPDPLLDFSVTRFSNVIWFAVTCAV